MKLQHIRQTTAAFAFSAALLISPVVSTLHAQANSASDQDKKFLDDTAQDSNFEIKTGQLALRKSSSADVKAYANMVIHDHTLLLQGTERADKVTNVTPQGTDSMSIGDRARYAELDLLSGKTFDDSYIKGLVKGNEESLLAAQNEASSSAIPAVKALAQKRVSMDAKHTARAKQMAAAHHIDSN